MNSSLLSNLASKAEPFEDSIGISNVTDDDIDGGGKGEMVPIDRVVRWDCDIGFCCPGTGEWGGDKSTLAVSSGDGGRMILVGRGGDSEGRCCLSRECCRCLALPRCICGCSCNVCWQSLTLSISAATSCPNFLWKSQISVSPSFSLSSPF